MPGVKNGGETAQIETKLPTQQSAESGSEGYDKNQFQHGPVRVFGYCWTGANTYATRPSSSAGIISPDLEQF